MSKLFKLAASGGASAVEIVYVGGITHTRSGTLASVNFSLTSLTGGIASAPAAGDLVIAYISIAGASVSSNLDATGYTQLAAITQADTVDSGLTVYYKFMGATPDTVLTLATGTGDANDSGALAIQVFRNVDPNKISAAVTAGATNSAIANPPAITPTIDNSVIIAGGAAGHTNGAQTFSSSDLTNFITVGSNDGYDATVGMGYKVWNTGDGTFDPAAFAFSGTTSASYSWNAVTFSIGPLTGAAQTLFTTTGAQSWTVPDGVTSISVVCIGGGEGGGAEYGGDGGGLRYVNNISVTPGETLTVTVGAGGAADNSSFTSSAGVNGGNSSLARSGTILCLARGGASASGTLVGSGGSGGNGGAPYPAPNANYGTPYSGGGGGGAGGYSGNGGNGASNTTAATAGAGGGGGGGGLDTSNATNDDVSLLSYGSDGSGGGGVGPYGSGSNGAAGTTGATPTGGGGGSSGNNGANAGTGGLYGGGGGGGYTTFVQGGAESGSSAGIGADGCVRIIWPGNARQFPSTRTTDE